MAPADNQNSRRDRPPAVCLSEWCQIKVLLDKPEHASEIVHRVRHEMRLGVGRNNDQRDAKSVLVEIVNRRPGGPIKATFWPCSPVHPEFK